MAPERHGADGHPSTLSLHLRVTQKRAKLTAAIGLRYGYMQAGGGLKIGSCHETKKKNKKKQVSNLIYN